MATISFNSDFKLGADAAQQLINALESSEPVKVSIVSEVVEVKDKEDIKEIMDSCVN
ncbi:hypothetical protein MOD96_02600 [Bacillus sp. S17B2]|uniref:hypothetical protein n=1 Tax=Bacillus sp. S17B2 TaxID=2918907 RepID=UPI002282BA34|nr:hypothetical protein [Bacillus sp. S17B2]